MEMMKTKLNYWAEWCLPCKEEIPELNRLYREGNKNGLVVFGINYDGFIDPSGRRLMMYFVEIKYPEDPNNRSYRVSRQRGISHYVRRIQQVLNNVVAPAISLTFRNLVSTSNTQVLMDHDHLEPPSSQVPEFRNGGEAHDDQHAYESMGGDGHFQFPSESIFNDQEHTDLPPDKVDSDFHGNSGELAVTLPTRFKTPYVDGFISACMNNGIYFAPSKYEAGFISFMHKELEIDKTLGIVKDIIKNVNPDLDFDIASRHLA